MSQLGRCRGCLGAIGGTLICALVVIFLDVVVYGCYMVSPFVCPIWCIVGAARAALKQQGLGVAAARILIPVATGLFVLANYSIQRRMAMRNAECLIEACERYRKANGAYPERLGKLVPRYLNSIPRAKYCCLWGEFWYFEGPPAHMLLWHEFPPYGRRVYNFDTGVWR